MLLCKLPYHGHSPESSRLCFGTWRPKPAPLHRRRFLFPLATILSEPSGTKTLPKIARSRSFLLVVALGFALSLTGDFTRNAWAHDEDKAAATAIPDTPAAIWQLIDQEAAETTKAIQTGALKDLHHHAYTIRDLVAALPEHSGSLPADKVTKIKADAKFVATLAQRLDAAGDSNNKAASVSNFDKLRDVLKAIRANYPELVTN